MYISYGLGLAFIFVLGTALWALTGWRLDKIAIWAVLLFLPFAPMLTFLSRVLWIYLDQKVRSIQNPSSSSLLGALE